MIKLLLFFITVTFPFVSYSWCKIDESVLDKSYVLPSLAKTVSIGIVIEENSKLFFVSNKPWEHFKLPIITEGCLGIEGLIKNEKYLFVSEQTHETLDGKSLDRTNGRLKILTSVSSTFAEGISYTNEIPKGFPNIFWGYCVGDSSCRKVEGLCGEKMSVNYMYTEKYINYSKEKNKSKKCETKKESAKFIPVKCVNYFCN